MEKALHSFQGFKNKQNQQKLCSFHLKGLSPFEFRTHWLELAVSLHLVPPIHNNTKPSVFTVLWLFEISLSELESRSFGLYCIT